MAAEQPQDKYVVRLPDGMRDRLKAAAEAHKRSMNAEIVDRLDRSFFEDTEDNFLRMLAEGRFLEPLPPGLAARIQSQAELRGQSVQEEVIQALEAAFPPPPSVYEFFRDWVVPIQAETDPVKRKAMAEEANRIAKLHWPSMRIDVPTELDET